MSDSIAKQFDPYHKWLGIPPDEQPPHHYRLLGVTVLESDPDVIENAADRQMSHLRSFQGGKNSAASQKLLNEVAAARVVLLNPAKKEAYDRQFNVGRAAAQLANESPAEPPLPRVAPVSVAPVARASVPVAPVAVAPPRPAPAPAPWSELEALERVVVRSASSPAPHRKPARSRAIPLVAAALVAASILIVVIVMAIKLQTNDGDSTVANDDRAAVIDRATGTGERAQAKPAGPVPHEAPVTANTDPVPAAAEVPAKPPIAAPEQTAATVANIDPPPATTASPEKLPAAIAAVEKPPGAAIQNAAIERWEKEVALLPVQQRLEAVMAKLRELNPGYDGQETHKIEADAIIELRIVTDSVTDISPLRALRQLKVLNCSGSGDGKSRLADLSPLKGLKLTNFNCRGTPVVDLAPLQGMPLTHLDCNMTHIADLSPLAGMPLVELFFWGASVSDLSPLKGMTVANLNCGGTPVSDLSPLRGTPLTGLDCAGAGNLTDLSPLRDTPLVGLSCYNTRVADLSPLAGLPLTYLNCANAPVTDVSPLERCNKLQFLQLQGTKVPAAAVAGLKKLLPNCQIGDP